MRRRSQVATSSSDAQVPATVEEEKPHERVESLLDTGDAITITSGREGFTPIRFHSFDVGPFSVTVHVRDGETQHDAIKRARAVLDDMAREELENKTRDYLEHVRKVAGAAAQAGIVVK